LKLLIVSWYFPPVNTIGAVRVGKFVRFLAERGHDVGVVAGKDWGHPETLPLGIVLDRVAYVRSIDIGAAPELLTRRVKRIFSSRSATADQDSRSDGLEVVPGIVGDLGGRRSMLHSLSEFYTHLINLPDNRIGWLPGAYRASRRMCRSWRPDLVVASGPPFTGFLVARRIADRLKVPWIAELRDRWADDPYDELPRWRSSLGQWLERRTLQTARAIVTVTEPWAEFYQGKYRKPVATIYNGYDPLDFDFVEGPSPAPAGAPLVIGYAGRIYPGRRDPTPLFESLRLLGVVGEQFRVVFCGTDPAQVFPLAARASVSHLVEVRNAVPYRESLEFQRQSDVLLLMQWNDPREQGNCPGKFFEYLACLRPILILGLENGVPATIARERNAGFCLNDPKAIAAQLRVWLQEKQELGRVRALPPSAREGLSRTIQFEKLERFLSELS
jgi:glycosyltransferase involved in cell wall biosynthesis